jgi:8-oxo-dGTP diphosphatase
MSADSNMTVVAAVIQERGRILIAQRKSTRSHPGKWEFPGGKVEPDETPRAALRRELREELGIEAEIGAEEARYTVTYRGNPPIDLLFYRVTAFRGEPRNLDFAQIAWVLPERLMDYDFLEGDVAFVKLLGKY